MLHEQEPRPEEHVADGGTPLSASGCEPERFIRHAHGARAAFACDPNQDIENRGVQMEMLVRIDVIQRQAGAGKCRELRADLGFELPANRRTGKIPHSPEKHLRADVSFGVRNAGNLPVRQ